MEVLAADKIRVGDEACFVLIAMDISEARMPLNGIGRHPRIGHAKVMDKRQPSASLMLAKIERPPSTVSEVPVMKSLSTRDRTACTIG